MANINLLPWREEARDRQKQRYLKILALVVVSCFCLVYLSLTLVGWMADEQRQRNQYLQNEISILEKQVSEIRSIKKRIKEIEQRTDIILNLQQARNLPTYILDELVKVVPSGIYLSSIEKKGNMLWIEGKSESNNHVANMMRRATNSDWLDQPNMQSIVSQNEALRQLQHFNLNIGIKDVDNKSDTGMISSE